ncbi:hypothetical protein V1527DRAFT_455681 [Lipomyces starkeyi]
MPRESLRQKILGDAEYALEKLLMLRAERRELVEGVQAPASGREMFVIADLLGEAGQESAVDDFLD